MLKYHKSYVANLLYTLFCLVLVSAVTAPCHGAPAEKPFAFLFPADLSELVEQLQRQDIEVHELREDIELDLKTYVLNIVDASNDARRARAAALDASLQIRSTATSAILGYIEARETWEYATGNLELNRRLFDLAREQHRLGAISLADFFGVEATLAQARATHIGALCDTYVQAAQINYLLGASELPAEEAE